MGYRNDFDANTGLGLHYDQVQAELKQAKKVLAPSARERRVNRRAQRRSLLERLLAWFR
jgi:hypothetical protein